jgi:hypothetical protein
MKTLLLGALISTSAFYVPPAAAEVIIYSGTARVNYIGQSQSLNLTFKLFLVVDDATADVGEILYANTHGQKFYSTDTVSNLHIVQVSGSGGKIYSAISQPPDDCDTNSTSEGVFLEGVVTTLKVTTNSSIYFPKTVTAVERSYDSSPPASLANGTLSANFDSKDTLISNSNGESLDQAVTRLITALQLQGYSEASRVTHRQGGPLVRQAARFLPAAGTAP